MKSRCDESGAPASRFYENRIFQPNRITTHRGAGSFAEDYNELISWRNVAAATIFLLMPVAQAQTPATWDPPKVCDACTDWNWPHEPFRLFGDTYYVGVHGLSSILIASDQGLILIDGGLTQSAPLIDANIRKLGFRTQDVRLILNSHTHFDHAGGLAALKRLSGARVAASAASAEALAQGAPLDSDPQYGFRPGNFFPPVKDVQVNGDNDVLRVGNQAITAHFTPGHTPGGTTWTWHSCEGDRCLDVVYADSLNAISAPGYRFTDDTAHPGTVEQFRRSIAVFEKLPCDILLTAHPNVSHMDEKLAARSPGQANDPLIDADACRRYAADVTALLDRRVREEH